MKNPIDVILQVATKALEEQAEQPDSKLGANGHLYYVLGALAISLFTEEQEQQIRHIIDLHQRCVYPLTFKGPGLVTRAPTPTSEHER